jgi:hypothetical protein
MRLQQPLVAQLCFTSSSKAFETYSCCTCTGATAFGMAPSALLSQQGSQALACRVIAGSRHPVVCRPSSAVQSLRCSNHAVRKTLAPVRAAAVSIFTCADNFVHDQAGLGAHPRGSSVWVVQAFCATPGPSRAMQCPTCITTASLPAYQTHSAFSQAQH